MEELFKKYKDLVDNLVRLPSIMRAQLPEEKEDEYSIKDVKSRLKKANLPILDIKEVKLKNPEFDEWELQLTLNKERREQIVNIRKGESVPIDEVHLNFNVLKPEDIEASKKAKTVIEIDTLFTPDLLSDFHEQIKILNLAAPNAVIFIDDSACIVRPGIWMHDVANTKVPPAPANMYMMHAIFEEKLERQPVWLHTHGLRRCGLLEIEILSIPKDYGSSVAHLINTTATMWMEKGMPHARELFRVGMGLDIMWLPWEIAIGSIGEEEPGSENDRDEFHSDPSAVLFAIDEKTDEPKNPSCYIPILEDNPILYISDMESNRMAMLAQDHLDIFKNLQEKYGKDEDWQFLVKIGYLIDKAEDDYDNEHLWFEVHKFEGKKVDATLLNQPYSISRMNEGDRAIHTLDRMSDWNIYNPYGQFTPESVVYLLRILENEKK